MCMCKRVIFTHSTSDLLPHASPFTSVLRVMSRLGMARTRVLPTISNKHMHVVVTMISTSIIVCNAASDIHVYVHLYT